MHRHKWAIMYDGSSELENVKIFALCIADAESGMYIINAEQLLSGNFGNDGYCRKELNRQEIEACLNELEEMKASAQ